MRAAVRVPTLMRLPDALRIMVTERAQLLLQDLVDVAVETLLAAAQQDARVILLGPAVVSQLRVVLQGPPQPVPHRLPVGGSPRRS